MRSARSKRVLVALGAAACALAVCACGSSGRSGTTASTGRASTLKFSNCMRSHGVPNFPDPSPGGGLLIPSGSGIDPQSPAFQDAQKACGALAPGGNGPPQMSETQRQHALAFAKCMRANGESKFPDPTLRPGNGVQLVLSIHGMVFALKAGIDPRSPSFRQAATACGLRLPSPGGKAQWAPAP